MQIKDIYLNHKSAVGVFIKILVVALAMFFIYHRFTGAEVTLHEVEWPKRTVVFLIVVLLLMIINWLLEAYRWKVSVAIFEPISLTSSLCTVLGGLALNWVLPFTSGDVVARLSQRGDKYKTTSAMVVNRGIMLSITLMYGLWSITSYSNFHIRANLTILGVVIPAFLLWIFRKQLRRFLGYFQDLGRKDLLKIVAISVVRYMIFTFQLFLLLSLFLPALTTGNLLLGVGWIFFFRSVFPSILGGLGVREASGLLYFSDIGNPMLVVIPIFLIWIINSVIPSIAGLFVISSWKARNIT